MRRRLMLFTLALLGAGLTGCDQPEWLNAQLDFYRQSGEYLYSVEVVWTNQAVRIPREAAIMEIQFSSRLMNGKRLPFSYVVRATDNGDGFEYVLAEGEQNSTSEPVFVAKMLRNAAGQPLLTKFQASIEATFIVTSMSIDYYYEDVVWTAHASFSALPEEFFGEGEEEDKTIQDDWGGGSLTTTNDGQKPGKENMR